MKRRIGLGTMFDIFNVVILILLAIICILPIINVLAVSFSASASAAAGEVKLWPVEFNLKSYEYAATKAEFWASFLVSVKRLIMGTLLSIILVTMASYALSKDNREMKFRNIYMWFIFFTTLFSGGIIPMYMTIKELGLIDSIWALVLYYSVPPFNIVIMLNFFRQIPSGLSEAAYIDGAGHWRILWTIFVPISKPAIATVVLMTAIFHWTYWFDGIMLINSPEKYPLMTYLQTIIVNKDPAILQHATPEELKMLQAISDKTSKASQIFLATIPILLLYPFLQKYFVKGIALGSVKG